VRCTVIFVHEASLTTLPFLGVSSLIELAAPPCAAIFFRSGLAGGQTLDQSVSASTLNNRSRLAFSRAKPGVGARLASST